MPKPCYKKLEAIQSLINRGSLTFWIGKEAISGRPRRFSDLAITTALMVKRVFSMPLRALQ
ncbi:transposase, partial [Vibrio splendidus]